MADEKPRANGKPEDRDAQEGPYAMENFSPLTSLEPDGIETLGAEGPSEGDPANDRGILPERPVNPGTWESIQDRKVDLRSGRPEEHGKQARREQDAREQEAKTASKKAAKTVAKSASRSRTRSVAAGGSSRDAKAGQGEDGRGMAARGEPASHEPPHGTIEARGRGKSADWTFARAEEAAEEESEADALLLDDSFLKRTFKEVHFPATKEMCLRFVDMEQDFVYGKDRTVNLHKMITHLEEEAFPTRRHLLKAIREHLSRHHHPHGP